MCTLLYAYFLAIFLVTRVNAFVITDCPQCAVPNSLDPTQDADFQTAGTNDDNGPSESGTMTLFKALELIQVSPQVLIRSRRVRRSPFGADTGTDAAKKGSKDSTGTADNAGKSGSGTGSDSAKSGTGTTGDAAKSSTGTGSDASKSSTGTADKAGKDSTSTADKAGKNGSDTAKNQEKNKDKKDDNEDKDKGKDDDDKNKDKDKDDKKEKKDKKCPKERPPQTGELLGAGAKLSLLKLEGCSHSI